MGSDSQSAGSLRLEQPRGEAMQTPDEVEAMLRLHGLGWGTRRIAAELGCSRTTVQRYVSASGWRGYRRTARLGKLAGRTAWLADRLQQHRGNADVVRQDLAREFGIIVSLRTLERAVAPLRLAMAAEARATLRFETPPTPRTATAATRSTRSATSPRWGPVDRSSRSINPASITAN